jgi:uncharacterized damage-inducible protein DinB
MISYTNADLANGFRTVRKNTVQVAEDIPENKYDFVAAPGFKSVADLLRHIATSPVMQEDMHRVKRVTTFKGYDFSAVHTIAAEKGKQLRGKSEIVAALRTEGERLASWLESLSDDFLNETFTDVAGQNPRTRFEGLLAVKEHEMHHRGQLMLIERMVGVVPHLTRQREERNRQRQAATAQRA